MFERCNRIAGSQSCALARFVACLRQAVQASSRCKSTERGQKQETVSSPASCSGNVCRRLQHRANLVAAPRPRGAVVRRCSVPTGANSIPIRVVPSARASWRERGAETKGKHAEHFFALLSCGCCSRRRPFFLCGFESPLPKDQACTSAKKQ